MLKKSSVWMRLPQLVARRQFDIVSEKYRKKRQNDYWIIVHNISILSRHCLGKVSAKSD